MAETLNLKILSPSTEVEGGISFPDIPTSTTIKELRSRIQDAVQSKPAPDRMRLIYRGRVVANDGDTLGNVFGAESVRARTAGHNLPTDSSHRSVKTKIRASTWSSESCLPPVLALLLPSHGLRLLRQTPSDQLKHP
jgi:hypothetical protein